jgi:hypothetical protein
MNQWAALAALALTATAAAAFDNPAQPQAPGVKFYFAIPLDAPTAKAQSFTAGFAISGSRPYETLYIDSRMLNNFIGGGLEAKFIIAGVVAAGAAAAVAGKDKSTSASYEAAKKKQAKTGSGGHDPNHPGHYPGDGCSACDPNHKP